jgi:hypothetical protein
MASSVKANAVSFFMTREDDDRVRCMLCFPADTTKEVKFQKAKKGTGPTNPYNHLTSKHSRAVTEYEATLESAAAPDSVQASASSSVKRPFGTAGSDEPQSSACASTSIKAPRLEEFQAKEYISPKAMTHFGWLDWIVEKNLPLSFCEAPTTRKYTSLEPICSKTLKKTLLQTLRLVEKKIKERIPESKGKSSGLWLHC